MVARGVERLTGRANIKSAWLKFVGPKDVIRNQVYSGPGPNSGTRPAVVEAVVQSYPGGQHSGHQRHRLGHAFNPSGWCSRTWPSATTSGGLYGVGYDPNVYDNETPGTLSAGDLEFDRDRATTGRKSYVSKLLTGSVTKIINIAPLLNHNLAGVCGNLYGLAMGSVDNTLRFMPNSSLPRRPLPEIYNMTNLSDHVVLNITDAL